MRFGEHSEEFGLWWETYACAQKAMGATHGQMAEALALQIMYMAEMLGQTFLSTAAVLETIVEIQRNIADVLAGGDPPRRRYDGMRGGES